MNATWTNAETGNTMTVFVHLIDAEGWAWINKGETKTACTFKVKAERLA